ncbi:RYamide receptor-like isoform X3 [Artemia franciscana]|uniref:RYamide receptor-like isoform X3 n=1 Tax=Artemia franciscana TaxID=6661 RepID=UPI0032DBD66A
MELEVFNITDPSVIVCSSNGTINSDDYYEECNNNMHTPSIFFQVIIYLMYSCIFLLALIGNGLVVCVIFSTRRKWTVTNYFIINLAISDILMAVACIPFSFVSTLILHYWPFGGFMCRTVQYSQVVSVVVSAYTMVVISGDRYFAIVYPLRPRMTRRQAKMIKMMITVVVVFALCWLPLNGFLLMYDLWPSIDSWTGISYAYFICHWTAMSHSSYNPFIYCCFHAGFRQGMTSLAYRMGCRKCFPVAESFDGMDAEMLQRGNTFSSYISRNSSLRFQRGSTLRPLLSSQPTRGSTYNRNSLPAFRTSPRFSESSDIVPVTTETQKESNGVCKIVFRNLSPRRSEGKVELRVFCEKEAV